MEDAATPSLPSRRDWPERFPVTGAWQPGDDPGARQFLHLDRPLALEGGAVLDEVTIAYESWGEQNAARDNTILLHTGLSASSHARSHDRNP